MGLSQADAARRLNVSRSVVSATLGINTNPKILCPEGLFQADHELQHLQKTVFSALSARRRRTTTVPQLVADHFQASGRRISATTVRNRSSSVMQVCMQEDQLCVRSPRTTAKERLCWARETCFLDAATMGFCAVHRQIQIYNGE
ncbi:uncharacterized protein TNCV_3137211 [Trichonephila clavipes]|nr:uncharacterized protein TNCV_3137211 [Trichonephila clavipes]